MRLETPEEAGAGELEVLKGMVLAWKEDYSRSYAYRSPCKSPA